MRDRTHLARPRLHAAARPGRHHRRHDRRSRCGPPRSPRSPRRSVAGGAPDGSLLDDLGPLALVCVAVGSILIGGDRGARHPRARDRLRRAGRGAARVRRPRRADRAHQLARGDPLGRGRVGRRAAAPDRARPARRRAAPARLHRDGAGPRPREARGATRRPSTTLLADAHDESKRAMRELRDLVRGIHPSVLSDRGLDAALSGLAERASVPVEISSGLERPAPARDRDRRLLRRRRDAHERRPPLRRLARARRHPPRRRHARARDRRRRPRRRASAALARAWKGLAQRVEALDGTLDVDSPRGGPTTITARMPCAS